MHAIVCGVLGGAIGGHFGQVWAMVLPLVLMVVLLPVWLTVVGVLGLVGKWQMEKMLGPLPPELKKMPARGEKPCEICGSPYSENYHRGSPYSKIHPGDSEPLDTIWLCKPCQLGVH